MTRTTHGVLGALVVLVFTLLPAAPAAAHTELKGTDPKAESTVTALLTEVTLTFTQAVKQSQTTVTITGADGVVYSDGAARSVDANVIQAVKPLPTGRVSVVWSAAAADGHPITGQFAFTNAVAPPPSPSPSPSPSSVAASSAAPSGSPVATVPRSDDGSGPGVGVIVAGAAGVVIALLAGLFLWRRSRS